MGLHLYETPKQTIVHSDRNEISDCLGSWDETIKETFWDNEDSLYHECGDDYGDIYICLSLSKCIFKMSAFYLCEYKRHSRKCL